CGASCGFGLRIRRSREFSVQRKSRFSWQRLAGTKKKSRLGRRPLQKITVKESNSGSGAALEGEQDEVCTAANAEFVEQIRNVELYSAFGDVEFTGDLLVGKILEKGIESFLFGATEIGDGVGF